MEFDDVLESDWYYEDVYYVYANGLMNGIGGNLFAPNATLTRAMTGYYPFTSRQRRIA